MDCFLSYCLFTHQLVRALIDSFITHPSIRPVYIYTSIYPFFSTNSSIHSIVYSSFYRSDIYLILFGVFFILPLHSHVSFSYLLMGRSLGICPCSVICTVRLNHPTTYTERLHYPTIIIIHLGYTTPLYTQFGYTPPLYT